MPKSQNMSQQPQTQIEPDEEKTPTTEHLKIEWHLNRDLLGVASATSNTGGFVSFFTKKGGKPFFISNVRKKDKPKCISWHPLEPLLAVGWSSGSVIFVDPFDKKEHEAKGLQLGNISQLLWGDNGLVLFVLDMKGTAKALKFESAEQMDKPKILGSGRIKDDMTPTGACNKLVSRHYLRQSSSRGGRMNLMTPGSRPTSEQKSGLAELLKKHKKNMDFVGEAEVTAAKSAAKDDLISVFFIATSKGGVYIFDPSSEQINRIFQTDSSIRQILGVPNRLSVIAITEGMIFYMLSLEGRVANDKIKVKLAGRGELFSMVQVENHVIALCYGEGEIRIWDLEAEDSAMFRLNKEKGYDPAERVVSVTYSTKKASICAATSKSRLATWRRVQQNDSVSRRDLPIDNQWQLSAPIPLNVSKILDIAWAYTSTAFAVNSGDSVQIFLSQGIEFYVDPEFAVLQMGAEVLTLVKITDPTEIQEINLQATVKGFYVMGKNLLLWDEGKITFYEIDCPTDSPMTVRMAGTFQAPGVVQAVYSSDNQAIYTLVSDQILIQTHQGTVKKAIAFRELEDKPELLSVKDRWMCVATERGYLRIYDISESNPKLVFQSTCVVKDVGSFLRFQTIRVNSTGNRVSFTVQMANEEICDKLFVWEAESSSVGYFAFHEGITDQQHYEQISALEMSNSGSGSGARPKTAAIRKIFDEQKRYRMLHHLPGNHFWDQSDPRFLVCEANNTSSENSSDQFILTMFVTSEQGIQVQDLQPKASKSGALMFVSIPYMYFLRNIETEYEDDTSAERSITRLILRRTIREFVGVDPNEKLELSAMLNFSFYLCAGQMDNAFKAIKFIKSESVWEHLAKMCVKTRRIDVARVCLGHMGNVRAAQAIRKLAENKASVEIQTARLAIELGMIDEAIRIYTAEHQYEMINRVYQSQGKWNEAFDIAERYDRIHLRNTHYNYAKYMESIGGIEMAIENYEKTSAHSFEIARMLCDEPKILEFYIKRRGESELFRWWAQYLESFGDMEMAKNMYHNANDHLSVVRIFCYKELIDDAVEVVNQTKDRAAAFHLALHFETLGDVKNAVVYFEKAGAYGSAIRLAKEDKMIDKLANLALMAGDAELIEAAEFYKDLPGHADKAVMLYHKAGMIGRALDLAFKTEQFGALDLIAQDLNENSDPLVLERSAEFFSANQQDKMAVKLLAYAKKYEVAVGLCTRKNVIINDELDTLLTPKKAENIPNTDRLELFGAIARCCLQQGNYHLAAKKFTQAGQKLEAMKALIKSGDTAKIILFANTARNQDIYRLAGNNLQTLNWKEDTSLMDKIVTFYKKANAMDSLASFYESCAQVEVDEFKDYEKAKAAYNEALRCLAKASERGSAGSRIDSRRIADRMEQLRTRIEIISEFLEIKKVYEQDAELALRRLKEMAGRPDMDETIRVGDIFAIIVLHDVRRSNFRRAWQLIEECERRKPKVDLRMHLNKHTIFQICDEAGVPRLKFQDENQGSENGDDENAVEYSHALKRIANEKEPVDNII